VRGTFGYSARMAVQPGTNISLNRRIIFLVLAILGAAIVAFLEFAKVNVQANVISGLFALSLVFGWAAFL